MLPPENSRIYWLARRIRKKIWWPYCSLSKKSRAAKSWKSSQTGSHPLYFLRFWLPLFRWQAEKKLWLCCTEPDLPWARSPYFSNEPAAPLKRTVWCQYHHEDAGLFQTSFPCFKEIFLWWSGTFLWENRLLFRRCLPLSVFPWQT